MKLQLVLVSTSNLSIKCFQDYKKMSPLATCLGDKITPEMEDLEKLENLSDCLTSRSLVAIDAKWQIDNKVFSFGGRQKTLRVWIGKSKAIMDDSSVFCINSKDKFPLLDNVEVSTDGNEANRSDIVRELLIEKK